MSKDDEPVGFMFLSYLDSLDKEHATFVWDGGMTMVDPGAVVTLTIPRHIWEQMENPTGIQLHMHETVIMSKKLLGEVKFRSVDNPEKGE